MNDIASIIVGTILATVSILGLSFVGAAAIRNNGERIRKEVRAEFAETFAASEQEKRSWMLAYEEKRSECVALQSRLVIQNLVYGCTKVRDIERKEKKQ